MKNALSHVRLTQTNAWPESSGRYRIRAPSSTCSPWAVIVEHYYGGDPAELHRRGPDKDASIRRLAGRPDVAISTAGLYRAVASYALVQRLKGGVSALRHLRVTHFYAVLPLPTDDQADLLGRARVEGWSARKLKRVVDARRRGESLPSPHFLRVLRRLHRLAQDVEGLDDVRSAPTVSVDEARSLLTAIEGSLAAIRQALP